ncbi:MAG: AtpZ/AtpI family protein [Oligoflexales bacterium]|nr:AtpZ/AtpI family protein [Oligoflexales bacterium]
MEQDSNKKDINLRAEYIQVFTRISVWIVSPVIFSLVLGKYLDNRYHTTPWILSVLLAISFTVSMAMIVKIAGEYMKDEKKDNEVK